MKKSWISAILAVIAFMAVYVALCYMVPGWRLKLEAPAMVYFAASLRHMALLKGLAAMAVALVAATVTAGSKTVIFAGHLKTVKMDREAELPVKPAMQKGVLYVPAAFFTEFLNDVNIGEGVVTIAPSMNYRDYVKAFFG